MLLLNPSKTEFLLLNIYQQLHKFNWMIPVQLGGLSADCSKCLYSLHISFDFTKSFSDHNKTRQISSLTFIFRILIESDPICFNTLTAST